MSSSLTVNPSDPVCFLPPDLAFEVLIVRYIAVGTLGVFIWELLDNILNDYKLLFKHQINLPTVAYFISKLSSLGLIILSPILQGPVQSCYWLEKSQDILFCVTIASTSLLFFFRTRAIFDRNPWVVTFFAGLWLAAVAGSLTTITGIYAMHIGSTKYCTNGKVKLYLLAADIIPLIYDTLVFLAITWRLFCISYTPKDRIRVLDFSDSLPALSKAMLKDGQAYYLTTITIGVATVIMLCNSSVSDDLRTILSIPNVMLMNIMACRVYRNTKFGNFRETHISTTFISRGPNAHGPSIPPSLGEQESGSGAKQAGDGIVNVDCREVECTDECAY